MKTLALLLFAICALLVSPSEPTNKQIRAAVESALNDPIRNVRLAGADDPLGGDAKPEIVALRKTDCRRAARADAYVCSLIVDLRTGGETLRRRIVARFLAGPGELTFARWIDVDGAPTAKS